MTKCRTTDQELIEIVNSSYSYSECLIKMGLKPAGGNYQTLKNRIQKLNLPTSHMTGSGWLKGKNHNFTPAIPLEKVLVANRPTNSNSLRKRLIKLDIFKAKCYNCGLTEWNGKPIPLELEHINGIHSDNRLENLTILCPNCHAQTSTYRSKNRASVVERNTRGS